MAFKRGLGDTVNTVAAELPPFMSVEPVTINLPLPPSLNNMFINIGRGRAKSKDYRAWLKAADAAFLEQKRKIHRVTGPCEIHIKVPTKTRGDISNRIKAAEDYLVSREITGDDKHNRKVTIERDDAVAWCVITVTPVSIADVLLNRIARDNA